MRHQIIVWAMLTAFALASCSRARPFNSENGALEGTIYAIGNEPFSNLGLKTKDGTMYTLHCSKEIEKDLSASQGKFLKVYFESKDQTQDGFTLNVIKIENPVNKK